jgi:hypothetical protein
LDKHYDKLVVLANRHVYKLKLKSMFSWIYSFVNSCTICHHKEKFLISHLPYAQVVVYVLCYVENDELNHLFRWKILGNFFMIPHYEGYMFEILCNLEKSCGFFFMVTYVWFHLLKKKTPQLPTNYLSI